MDFFRFPLSLQVRLQVRTFGVELEVKMVVVDRDAPSGKRERMAVGTGETLSFEDLDQLTHYLMSFREISPVSEARKQALVERALAFVRCVVLHELDECTLVNGERIYDPHIPERRRFDAHP